MCHYITGILSGKVTLEEVNTVGYEFGLEFEICSNEFVQSQLEKDEVYIWKKCKYCDCGTPLGMLNPSKINQGERITESEIKKLKQKGWSESKIQRFLSDRNKNKDKYTKKLEERTSLAEEGIQQWVDFPKKLFETTQIKAFGILLHWYSGDLETERIHIARRKMMNHSDLSAKMLLEMEEDTLYICENK